MRSTSVEPYGNLIFSNNVVKSFPLLFLKKICGTVKSKCTISGIPHVLDDNLDRLENHHWAKNTSVEAEG